MDSPELTRLAVLHTSILTYVLGGGTAPPELLQEADALTMLLALRSRSAVNYHLTARGRDALENRDALQLALEEGRAKEDGSEVEILRYRFSPNQAASPFRSQKEPEEEVVIKADARGVAFFNPKPEDPES